MMDAYIEFMYNLFFALLATAVCLIMAGAVVGVLFAMYKGLTDETWR